MVTCKPWFGMGVRHIQYILMGIMNCLDFWIQALNMALYMDKTAPIDALTKKRIMEQGGRISYDPVQGILLTPEEKQGIYMLCYSMYSLGRILCSCLVIRLPNKYLLLGLVVLENVTGGTMVWFVKYAGLFGIASCLTLSSFCRSFHAPLMHNILAKWMPPNEYTTTFCIITIVKEMFSFFLSHLVAKMNFMESKVAFMLLTVIYLGWCAIFLVFGAESPQTSYLISKQEWNYLSRTIGPRKKIHCKAKAPFKSIFMCFIFYMYILMDFGKECNDTVINSAVQTISGSADTSGPLLICLQAALMVYSFGLLISCIFMDKAIGKEKIEAGPTRKVMTTVASCGVAITMILTAYVDGHRSKIGYLFLSQCFFMILNTAEPAILFDLSPNYAAVVYAIVSFVRNLMIAGKMQVDHQFNEFDLTLKGPNVTTHIGPKSPDGMIYRYGFLIFFTNLFFIISGNIELKDFDSYDTHDWRKESVISYP